MRFPLIEIMSAWKHLRGRKVTHSKANVTLTSGKIKRFAITQKLRNYACNHSAHARPYLSVILTGRVDI